MKTLSVAVLLVCACLGNMIAFGQSSTHEDMWKAILTNGLDTFCATCIEKSWHSPYIDSQWYVNRITNMEARIQAQTARDIGYRIAIKLDGTAPSINQPAPWSVYERNAYMLLTLGNWLSKSDGYGNIVLANRCYDMAYISLAKMIFDTSCPTSTIACLLSIYDMSWYNPCRIAAILAKESGMPSFGSVATKRNIDSDAMYGALEEELSAAMKAAVSNPVGQVSEIVLHNGKRVTIDRQQLDDVFLGATVETVRDGWHSTHLRLLLCNAPAKNNDRKERLLSFLRFRTVVGSFPTHPTNKVNYITGVGDNIVDEQVLIIYSFEEAWRAHCTNNLKDCEDSLPSVSTVSSMYYFYLKGRFMDKDSEIEEERHRSR